MNDIAFVTEAVLPALASLGIDHQLFGARPHDPAVGRASFLERAIRTQLDILGARPYDILHINYGLFGPYAFETRRPAVLHLHGSDIRPSRQFRYRIANIVSKVSARRARDVWYSTTDLAGYVRLGGIEGRFMPNPVSQEFLATGRPFPNPPHVLFAVPLCLEKGADVAISAMRMLSETPKNVEISSFSFGPVPEIAASLRARIPSSVRLLPWSQRNDMPKLFQSASVVVGRLRLGSLGMVELEAMGSGRPVVMQLPHSPAESEEYYKDDPPVVSCNSAEEVALAVTDLLATPSVMTSYGARGRAWVGRYHSAQRVAALYLEAYHRLREPGGS